MTTWSQLGCSFLRWACVRSDHPSSESVSRSVHFLGLSRSFFPAMTPLQLWSFSSGVMIPTKMLVYRSPDGATRTETLQNTRRRKKSCGELFHNGYRVKMIHGAEREESHSCQHTLSSCFHAVSYWGKNWSRRIDGRTRSSDNQLQMFPLILETRDK